jgi:hypothetical protein
VPLDIRQLINPEVTGFKFCPLDKTQKAFGLGRAPVSNQDQDPMLPATKAAQQCLAPTAAGIH